MAPGIAPPTSEAHTGATHNDARRHVILCLIVAVAVKFAIEYTQLTTDELQPAGKPSPAVGQVEQHVRRLTSWDDVKAAYREPMDVRAPFIVDSVLTKKWPVFREWSSLERLAARFATVNARTARGSRIGFDEKRGVQVCNPITAPQELTERLQKMGKIHTKTVHSNVRTAVDTVFAGQYSYYSSVSKGGDEEENKVEAKEEEEPPAYIHWRLNDSHWEEARGLFGSEMPDFFDDARFLRCLDQPQRDLFKERYSWHQIIVSQQGSGIPLHFHGDHNHLWSLQLVGQKSWFICPPSVGPDLYHAMVDAFNDTQAARERFPRFFEDARESCYRVTAHPGEIIYWQSRWWHQTIIPTEEKSETPSISLTACFIDEDVILTNRCVRDYDPSRPLPPSPVAGDEDEAKCATHCSACAVRTLSMPVRPNDACEASPAVCMTERFDPEDKIFFHAASDDVSAKYGTSIRFCKKEWRTSAAAGRP
jgi:hypothetical protein